jgi:N-acetylglucosaminyldiphosphoundecaprenol N-acetyl-beta-D-mannosaminyltransferase
MKVDIGGAQVDCYSFNEVVDMTVDRALTGITPTYIVTPNAQHINNLQKDDLFREIYSKAFLAIPDGMSIVWAAKFLKTPVREKVSGSNLFEKLCEIGASKPLRIFFLGGRPHAAERAAHMLESRYPGLEIVGTYCPDYGFESDPVAVDLINQKIADAAPNLLFVGLGSPKQEKWIYANYRQLKVPVSIGIGVSFEFIAGMVKRAPIWMQNAGLEWLFRLLTEPKRLWKRYVLGNPLFIFLVLRQKLQHSKYQSARRKRSHPTR